MTLRTVPFNTMPGFRSFISSTSLRRIGRGISSRGSRAGFSSSFTISVSVISPIPSSSASFFLSGMRRSSAETAAVFWLPDVLLPAAAPVDAFAAFNAPAPDRPDAFAPFLPVPPLSASKVIPCMAAASARPIAVSVLRMLKPFCLRSLRFALFLADTFWRTASPEVFLLSAPDVFCAARPFLASACSMRTSSMESSSFFNNSIVAG